MVCFLVDRLCLHSVGQFVVTFHDYSFTRQKASFHHGHIVRFRSEFDEAFFGYPVVSEDEYVCTVLFRHYRFRRHYHCIFTDVEKQGDVGKLAREQFPLRIRHFGPDARVMVT